MNNSAVDQFVEAGLIPGFWPDVEVSSNKSRLYRCRKNNLAKGINSVVPSFMFTVHF